MKGAQLLRTMHRLCSVCVLAVQKLQKGDPVIFVWTAPHAWIDKYVTRMRRVDITIIILYHSTCKAARAAICPACLSICACERFCVARVCVCVCACVVVAAASTEPTDLRFRRRFALSESIRYKLSRIQLPEYKGTCHTTNVSRSDSSSVFCGFAPWHSPIKASASLNPV
jgi:hypothetical protein